MANSNRTIISNYNKDVNTNTIISEPITQTDYINPLSPIITLWQIPEKFSRVQVKNEDGANTYKVEVFNLSDVINSTYFYVDYTAQNVYFHISEVGKKVTLSYMGYGSQKISSSLIFTKVDDEGNISELLSDVIDGGKDAIEAISTLGSAVEIINQLDETIVQANSDKTTIINSIDAKITEGESTITDIETAMNNGDISNIKSDISTVNSNIISINSSLSDVTIQKMDKSTDDIGITQINKNKGLIDETYLSDTLKSQIAGTTAIGSTPTNFSITQKKMAEPYVKSKKGLNLFDTTDYISGFSIDGTGALISTPTQGITDYINVSADTIYTIRNSTSYQNVFAFYDNNKNFISRNAGGSGTNITFTTPANTVYIRICFTLTYINSCQLVLGSYVLNPYIPFRYEFDSEQIYTPISKSKLDTSIVYGINSINLFNLLTLTIGNYVVATNGTIYTASGFNASDYIPLLANTDYVISGTGTVEQYAFYDANKVFLSGSVGGNLNVSRGYKFTTPANTAYVRLSVKDAYINTFQLELGIIVSEYTSYGIKTNRSLIQNLRPKNVFIVAKSNGDYSTINEAIAKVRDSVDNPITIVIMPGIYIEMVDIRNRYISLVGLNKKTCILRYDDGNYGNFPINMWAKNNIYNLTVISTHDNGLTITGLPAYAIHYDYTGIGENEIENCTLISYQHAGIGIGLHDQQTFKIKNCEIYSRSIDGNGGAIFAHNQQANGGTNQKLILTNCIVKSLIGHSIVVEDSNHLAGGGYGDIMDTIFTFYNNMFWSNELKSACTRFDTPLSIGKLSGYISLGEDSYGNNLATLNAY